MVEICQLYCYDNWHWTERNKDNVSEFVQNIRNRQTRDYQSSSKIQRERDFSAMNSVHDESNSSLSPMIKEEIMMLNSFARDIKEFP